ncbi:gamma-glutamylcyclotransferase [Rhodomicrobium lacus]|uniref:gamma-glutamylcyclotransferase n=1 Tax=Rhodomicrobium lacus TaxID=2498452 RepID=UPI00349F8F21
MDLWIFGYGSLMWRPGFVYEESSRALLEGAHRELCCYSFIHRGTRSAPGLVLGLDKGGRCEGMAFRVPPRLDLDTRHYLKRRENMNNVYAAVKRPVRLLDGSGRTVLALCFIMDRHHRQYTGLLPLETQAAIVRRSFGRAGPNIDYVVNTVQHLRQLGVHDARLEPLMARLGHSVIRDCIVGGECAPARRRPTFDVARPVTQNLTS